MNFEDVLKIAPELHPYVKNMPDDLKPFFSVRIAAPGEIIHQKNAILDYFAFICTGEHRVLNVFENGNLYMIEKNRPIDFIGEVAILAEKPYTSVTIEAISESILLQLPRRAFERWIEQDPNLMALLARRIALKLFQSSARSGEVMFYPSSVVFIDYILKYLSQYEHTEGVVVIPLTRQQISEELGIGIKTINRLIKKLRDDNLLEDEKGKIMFRLEKASQIQRYAEKLKRDKLE